MEIRPPRQRTGQGWLDVYECKDSECKNCPHSERHEIEFGACKRAGACPGLYVMWTCDENGHVSRNYYSQEWLWRVLPCDGTPDVTYTHDRCYPNRIEENGLNFLVDECGNHGDSIRGSWVRFECQLAEQELRQSSVSEDTNNNMSVGIAVAVLLIVFMIGVMAGYLVHRKRKKSANRIHLLSNASDVTESL